MFITFVWEAVWFCEHLMTWTLNKLSDIYNIHESTKLPISFNFQPVLAYVHAFLFIHQGNDVLRSLLYTWCMIISKKLHVSDSLIVKKMMTIFRMKTSLKVLLKLLTTTPQNQRNKQKNLHTFQRFLLVHTVKLFYSLLHTSNLPSKNRHTNMFEPLTGDVGSLYH